MQYRFEFLTSFTHCSFSQRLPDLAMTIAQDSINVLLEVNALYQRIASVNPLTQQTSRFYDRITQIVQTRSQQAFSPDLGLPYQEWSQSAGGYVPPVNTVEPNANMVCTHLGRVWERGCI
jgi:hypothetical protein